MTLRLQNTDGMTTQLLLGAILKEIRQGERVSFLCQAGHGGAVMQRVRVALSRIRAEMEKKGKPIARFNMRNTIHPETHFGKRFDCVIVWHERKEHHQIMESLEDLLERTGT